MTYVPTHQAVFQRLITRLSWRRHKKPPREIPADNPPPPMDELRELTTDACREALVRTLSPLGDQGGDTLPGWSEHTDAVADDDTLRERRQEAVQELKARIRTVRDRCCKVYGDLGPQIVLDGTNGVLHGTLPAPNPTTKGGDAKRR